MAARVTGGIKRTVDCALNLVRPSWYRQTFRECSRETHATYQKGSMKPIWVFCTVTLFTMYTVTYFGHERKLF
jgi:hypothetical protein